MTALLTCLDYNKAMWIMLVLFLTNSIADDMASERYCFRSSSESLQARAKVTGIQVSSDVVTVDDECLVIQMRPHRRELIQRFILSSYPDAKISFSSAEIKRDPCLLKVEKIKSLNAKEISVGANGEQIFANESTTTGNGSETMEIQTLKEFQLTVNQDEIKGECRLINPRRYEISITVSKLPKPIVPVNTPPGTIVVLNNPPPPQETMTLQTQLQLDLGQRVELGEIVKNLRDKNRRVDISPEAQIGTEQNTSVEKVFLSIQ